MNNRKQFAAAAALLTFISISLVAPDAEAQRRRAVERHSNLSTLSGIVTDASSGEPLAGAHVTIGDSTRTTNAKGEYKFINLALGTWSVTADRWGYGSVTREVEVGPEGATADFALTLNPWVTVTRTTGEVERYAFETVEFGYTLPFTGTFSSPDLTVCTGDPTQPIVLEPGSIAQIHGPAQRVSTTCCPNFDGEQVQIERTTGEVFDAVILDSCPPYEIYFIGRSLDAGSVIYRRLSEVSLIEFPQQ